MAYVKEKMVPGYTGKFVISEHHATHWHWDFRLEFEVTSVSRALADYSGKRPTKGVEPTPEAPDKPGPVLRSWAVPKHRFPDNKPILATETENHAIQYWGFHGVIPSGYGAGTVSIIDKGTYTLEDVEFDKKYVFTLHGKKHTGRYALIKTGGGKSFLWVKTKEQTKKSCISEYLRRLASAIDYPRPTMNAEVWDLKSGFPPKLRSDMKKKLLSKLFKALPKAGVTEVFLSGSMAGNIADETGDVDIDIEYDSSKIDKTPEELQHMLDSVNRKRIEGSKLLTAFMVLAPGDHPMSEGVYDILNDRWIRGPVMIPTNFDPDQAFQSQKRNALQIAQTIDILIRDIYRTVKDLISCMAAWTVSGSSSCIKFSCSARY